MTLGQILETFRDEKQIVQTAPLEFVEKDKNGISLKGVLQRGRLKLGREKPAIRTGVGFSPSTLTYTYCRRLKVAQLAGLVEIYYEKARPAQQFQFDIGHAVHEIIQGYFWDIGILKGTYKCIKCEKLYYDLISPKVCPSGIKTHKRKHLKYKEVKASNDSYAISGRCDGILVIDDDLHLMDIKTIQNRTIKSNDRQFCFEDLDKKGPKDFHVVQLNFYMWMLGVHKGHLLYASKNDGQLKSFYIPYSEEVIRPYLNEIDNLRSLASQLKNGEKPVLPDPCGDKDCECHKILASSTG